ncbi:hypothetical protein ABB30_11135 [Stenotrophomonas ginsengisoli]|uniref:Uncharacterized protein n=1 Tax=Stenotrophomonas ginsengisoli TaxID=336566 RepID=A0A0R0D0W5_9GAMM|nr:hypothetical protein ABB30_11135 [Stenotrophomonas ginsengisoli]
MFIKYGVHGEQFSEKTLDLKICKQSSVASIEQFLPKREASVNEFHKIFLVLYSSNLVYQILT